MVKNIIVFIIVSLFLAIAHIYIIPLWITADSITEVVKQHLLLGLFSVLIYVSTYIASKKMPTQAGFLFIGLLMAKMVTAAIYLYGRSWLDENSGDPRKYVFFLFYIIYLVVLVVITSKLLNKQMDNKL